MDTQTQDFDAALAAFIATAQSVIDAHFAQNFPTLDRPVLSAEVGQKNVRIVRADRAQRSVHCFVRIEDGAILKADGWKRPAKHARGSIYVDAGRPALTPYGVHYLR